MNTTAAEVLRSAEPPVDDGGIDQALAELDVKIWNWTDVMLGARAAIKRSLARRETSSRTTGEDVAPTSPEPPPPVQPLASVTPIPQAQGGQGQTVGGAGAWPETPAAAPQQQPAFGSGWAATPTEPHHAASSGQASQTGHGGDWKPGMTMAWPEPDAVAGGSGTVTPLAWPSFEPNAAWPPASPGESAAGQASSTPTSPKPSERARKPAPPRISPEETALRAERLAREEAMLEALDDTTARRVRLLRRLDPDAEIEQLIEKARQTQSREGENREKTDKASWWRRK